MRFVFIIGHSTHETARTVSPSSSIKGWMPLMCLLGADLSNINDLALFVASLLQWFWQ